MQLQYLRLCKNIKKSRKNKKLKISTPTWNDKSELLVGSSFLSGIQDYFEHIIKKLKTLTGETIKIKIM